MSEVHTLDFGRLAAEIVNGKSYVGAACTLDEKSATITGRSMRCATVAQLPDGLRVEVSWQAVSRIMRDHGGRFAS